jgi:exosortase
MNTSSLRQRWLLAAACALAGAAVFQFLGNSTRGYIGTSSLFYWWGFQWFNPQSETEHGLLIIALSVWLVSRNLASGPRHDEKSEGGLAAGTCAMVFGMLVHVLGFVAEQDRLSIMGLLFFTWGVLAFGGGRRWARATAFPVAFMVFAIPLSAMDSAGFWLRMWVVRASSVILHALSIQVIVNGTLLLSPDGSYNYDVAAACSGVRSLVAITALSFLIGYLHFRRSLMWVAMFAAAFPLILVGNIIRIVAIVVAARAGGQVWGDRVHEVMGFAVFAMVLGGVLLIADAIGRSRPDFLRPGPGAPERPARTTAPPRGGAASNGKVLVAAGLVGCVSMIAALVLMHVARLPGSAGTGINLAGDGLNPVALPEFLGQDWMGRRTDVTEVERQVLPADTGFSRKIYVSLTDPSKQVFLSIVLSGRDRSSIHRPEYCLVGQGWTIRGGFSHEFNFPGSGQFRATVLRVEKDLVTPGGSRKIPQLFAYYFVNADSTVATNWERMTTDSWNRVVHGRSDRWAYVVVQTGSSDGEGAALDRIQSILDGAAPAFQKHT